MEKIERVILENDVFLMDSEDDLASLVTQISNLEKISGDIPTQLRLLSNCFNAVPKSPLESVCKQVQFANDEIVEPHTP